MRIELRAGLLILAFALPSASSAAKPATVPLARWVAAKDDARRWTDGLLEKAAKSGTADVDGIRSELDYAWGVAANAEKAERLLNDKRLVAKPKEARWSQQLLELNLLYVYGNVLPRALHEVELNVAPGRAPEPKIAVEEDAYRAQWAGLKKVLTVPANMNPEMPAPGGAD